MGSDAVPEAPRLERLYREAFDRLETFPSKVVELNGLVEKCMPASVKNSERGNSTRRLARYRSALSTVRDCDLTSVPGFDASSYCSLSMCDRDRLRHGICKRRYYRTRGINGVAMRRRPGPLARLLAFLIGRLSDCARRILVAPSRFVLENAARIVLPPAKQKNSECRTAPNWSSSLSVFVCNAKKDRSAIGRLIDILRPATIEMISDTTTLKRWLQTAALSTEEEPRLEIANATRITETIDCWAYELFFHLKYLRENRARRIAGQAGEDKSTSNEDVVHANLWHRLVQLRDNYIILYERFRECEKALDPEPGK